MKVDKLFYQALCAWNRQKTWKTFWAMFKHGFNCSFKDLFGWRFYRIIRNTLNGRYKQCEAELRKQLEEQGL